MWEGGGGSMGGGGMGGVWAGVWGGGGILIRGSNLVGFSGEGAELQQS